MAAANDTGSLYSIEVVHAQKSGEDFVWTLRLSSGFQKKQCISICKNGTKRGFGSVHNHTIVEPVAEQEVRAKASLFVASPTEYSFW
jgi:hypothetical protein